MPPSSQIVIENNLITLSCTGKGKPSPSISWLKDGMLLVNVESIETFEESTIILPNATIDDAGSYQCQLENFIGRVISQPAIITIYSKLGLIFKTLMSIFLLSLCISCL